MVKKWRNLPASPHKQRTPSSTRRCQVSRVIRQPGTRSRGVRAGGGKEPSRHVWVPGRRKSHTHPQKQRRPLTTGRMSSAFMCDAVLPPKQPSPLPLTTTFERVECLPQLTFRFVRNQTRGRQMLALSSRSPGFNPRLLCLTFVTHEVALDRTIQRESSGFPHSYRLVRHGNTALAAPLLGNGRFFSP
jgi:hypothetical protein